MTKSNVVLPADFKLPFHFIPFYDNLNGNLPQIDQLTLPEAYLYSFLINFDRTSVAYGRNGRFGKCYFNPYDEEYYIATSAPKLSKIQWLPNNPKTINKYLRHLESLKLIKRYRRDGFSVIEVVSIHDTIEKWEGNKWSNVQRGNKRSNDRKGNKWSNVNINSTNNTNSKQYKSIYMNNASNKFSDVIKKTHKQLGLIVNSLKTISGFSSSYKKYSNIINKLMTVTSYKHNKKLIDLKNNGTYINKKLLNFRTSPYFNSNDFIEDLNNIFGQIDYNTKHNTKKPNRSKYAGYLVSTLTECMITYLIDNKYVKVNNRKHQSRKPHKQKMSKEDKELLESDNQYFKHHKLHKTPKSLQKKIKKQLHDLNKRSNGKPSKPNNDNSNKDNHDKTKNGTDGKNKGNHKQLLTKDQRNLINNHQKLFRKAKTKVIHDMKESKDDLPFDDGQKEDKSLDENDKKDILPRTIKAMKKNLKHKQDKIDEKKQVQEQKETDQNYKQTIKNLGVKDTVPSNDLDDTDDLPF